MKKVKKIKKRFAEKFKKTQKYFYYFKKISAVDSKIKFCRETFFIYPNMQKEDFISIES